MKAGPKAAVDDSPLPWRRRSVGSARFGKFCERYIKVPKGTGAPPPRRNPRYTLLGGVRVRGSLRGSGIRNPNTWGPAPFEYPGS